MKRLIINDQMLAAVAALPGSTDAINSAQWSSGLLLGTCCSCHRARLIIPSPSLSPRLTPPARGHREAAASAPHPRPISPLHPPFLGSAKMLRARNKEVKVGERVSVSVFTIAPCAQI